MCPHINKRKKKRIVYSILKAYFQLLKVKKATKSSKYCKILKIHSKARKLPNKKASEESIKYPNIIWNNWNTTRPFEIIVTDTTIFYIE